MYVYLKGGEVGLILCLVLIFLYPIIPRGYVRYVIESIFCFFVFVLLVVSLLTFVLLVVSLLSFIFSFIILVLVCLDWVRASFIFLVGWVDLRIYRETFSPFTG